MILQVGPVKEPVSCNGLRPILQLYNLPVKITAFLQAITGYRLGNKKPSVCKNWNAESPISPKYQNLFKGKIA